MIDSHNSLNNSENTHKSVSLLKVALILFGFVLIMFGDVLFTSKDTILSLFGTDVSHQFLDWRFFGFSQLRQGNFPLWNPHNFSGEPYFGGFQAALLYPLNFIFLILTAGLAINWCFAVHVYLSGMFMYLWVSYRGINPLAGILSAVLFMFCSAQMLHIYSGHPSYQCAMIWSPLVFLSIDGIFKEQTLKWFLIGIFAVTMSILAGHPQYVFYTAIAVVIYTLLCCRGEQNKLKSILNVFSIYLGAFALSAVQIFTGLQAGSESVRTGGLSYELASVLSFPPENFLTLIAPKFFGDGLSLSYWGRWWFWEMVCFVSITGLCLAIYGAIYGDKKIRRYSVTLTALLIIFAMGAYTPIYKILYEYLPGFNRFRSTGKFIFLISLFLSILAGIGFDHLLKYKKISSKSIGILMGSGIILFIMACGIYILNATNPMGSWHKIMQGVLSTHQSYLNPQYYQDKDFIYHAGLNSSKSLLIASITLFLLSTFLSLLKYNHRWIYALGGLAILEMLIFNWTTRPTFQFEETRNPELESVLSHDQGDYRILNSKNINIAMRLNANDIWGNDPFVIRRYAEFIAYTQGMNPDDARQYIPFTHYDKLYSMLRCKYAFFPRQQVQEFNSVLPHVLLVQDYSLIPDRDKIFSAMEKDTFDPRKEVILESIPDPIPIKSDEKGTVKIEDSATDYLTIDAELPHPAILLITDVYSKGWHVKSILKNSQTKYNLMPANYMLRAIPLGEGHHKLRVEYLPKAYVIGKWISIISCIIYLGLIGIWWSRKRKLS